MMHVAKAISYITEINIFLYLMIKTLLYPRYTKFDKALCGALYTTGLVPDFVKIIYDSHEDISYLPEARMDLIWDIKIDLETD